MQNLNSAFWKTTTTPRAIAILNKTPSRWPCKTRRSNQLAAALSQNMQLWTTRRPANTTSLDTLSRKHNFAQHADALTQLQTTCRRAMEPRNPVALIKLSTTRPRSVKQHAVAQSHMPTGYHIKIVTARKQAVRSCFSACVTEPFVNAKFGFCNGLIWTL